MQRKVQVAIAEALDDERRAPTLRRIAGDLDEQLTVACDELDLAGEPIERSMVAGFLANWRTMVPDS